MFIRTLISAAIVAASVSCASAADISGAGATFPYPDLRQMGRHL